MRGHWLNAAGQLLGLRRLVRSKRFREEARLREPAGAGPGVRKMLPNSLSPMGP